MALLPNRHIAPPLEKIRWVCVSVVPLEFITLNPNKRVLFLKDLQLIKEQLYNGLNLNMDYGHLLDDINTDVMTPAWVCLTANRCNR